VRPSLLLLALQAVYLFSPLFVAAALSGVVLRFDLLPALRRPLDGGATLGGRRVFGDNKTLRGLLVGVVGATAGVLAQRYLVGARAGGVALLDYEHVHPVALGAAIGGGAILGELPNSFVKRRVGVAPGAAGKGALGALFYVWDQIDLLTLSWPLLGFWIHPSAELAGVSFALALIAHQLVSILGWAVGARKSAR
jgi:hypothetical protein